MKTNAAESATAGVPVVPVVRGLVWEVDPYTLNAQGYRIEYGEGGRLHLRSSEASGMFGTIEFADSVDAAKAAAQADYEQRIRYALNPDFLSALDTARAEIESLRKRYDDSSDYSIDLQRIIEDLTHSRPIREPQTTAHFHYDMAVAYQSALTAAQARIAELEGALSKIDHEYETEYAGRSYTRCTCCHVALSDGHPHLADCAWATLSPAVKEPK